MESSATTAPTLPIRETIIGAEVVNKEQAEFIANFGGYHIMAIATVRETDKDGFIKRLTVRPK